MLEKYTGDMGREGVVIPPRGGTFSTPEGALLLVSTKNHDLWPDLGF